MNPMLNQMSNIGQIKNMMNMVRSAGDPNAMLQSIARTNPQMRQVMDVVRMNNGDARTAFYNLAQQKGIDPNSILNMLK